MIYLEPISQLIVELEKSIENGTFAKLTLGKTPGKTDLVNIYFRTHIDEVGHLKFKVLHRFQNEEITKIEEIKNTKDLLAQYINNPFLTVILFTTEKDVLIKLNKKRIPTLSEMDNTFKHADPVLLEFLKK
jgi:hypothetical protein